MRDRDPPGEVREVERERGAGIAFHDQHCPLGPVTRALKVAQREHAEAGAGEHARVLRGKPDRPVEQPGGLLAICVVLGYRGPKQDVDLARVSIDCLSQQGEVIVQPALVDQ